MPPSTCRVLGDPGERRRTLDGLRSAHGFLQRRVAGELRLKHTPTLDFVYDDTIDRGFRIDELLEREAGESESVNGATSTREQVLREIRDADKLVCTTHENPDGDALGSLVAMHADARRARQGRGLFMRRARVPAALRVPLLRARRSRRTSRPPTSSERTIVFLDCGNIDRNAGRRAQARRRPHPQHRPPPRQHALRHGQPRGARRVVHGGDRVGPDATGSASRRRRRSPRRCTSGW